MKVGPSPPAPPVAKDRGPRAGSLQSRCPRGVRTKDLGRSSAQPADSSRHPGPEPQAGWASLGARISAASQCPHTTPKCSGGPPHSQI